MKKIKIFLISLFFLYNSGGIFADSFVTDFLNPSDYTYNSEVEISGGFASLKEKSLWNGIIGYWKMDDISGFIIDSSGYGNDGINFGASYGALGKVNSALYFDGINDYMEIPASPILDTSNEISISAWIYDSGDGSVSHSINKDDEVNNRIWIIRRNNDNSVNFHIWNSSGILNMFTPPGSWVINQWFHLVVTAKVVGGNIEMEVFFNGVSVGTTSFPGTAMKTSTSAPIRIASGAGHKEQMVDELIIYNKALSALEVSELYNSGLGKEVFQYSNINQSVFKTNGDSGVIQNFTGFYETMGLGNSGTIAYQLSTDGINWQYWNGTNWTNATSSQYNSASIINNNINLFPSSQNNIYVKAFLISDGTQAVELDQIQVDYNVYIPPTFTSGGKSGKIIKGKSGKKTCKDSKALNFSNIGQHNQDLCVYKKNIKNNQVENKNKCIISGIFKQNMKIGDKDNRYSLWENGVVGEVKKLQSYMNKMGFRSGVEDGNFGLITEKAVKRMQLFLNTKTDGLFGPKTRALLNNFCN